MSAGRSKWRRRSAILNGQANVLPMSPAAYLGEWFTHLLPLLSLFAQPFNTYQYCDRLRGQERVQVQFVYRIKRE